MGKKFCLVDDVAELKKEVEKGLDNTIIKSEVEKKNKLMTIKLRPSDFSKFTEINIKPGITNSGATNMLITDYIRQYEYLLK